MGHVVRIFICLFASAFVGVAEAQTIHGWRGDGTGVDPTANPPLEWSKEKNVAWQTEVGRGFSSPVVVGGKVFVTAEPDELVCLDKTSGKILWRKSNGVKDLPAELQNRNLDLPTDCGYASPTPCSDGKFIFAFLGTGVVSCHDLDGNRKWIRLLEIEPKESNGRSASPVLFDDHLLVHASDLFCLDAKTGKTLWQKEAKPAFGTLAVAKVGDTEVAFIPMGDVFRLSDGEKLASNLAVCEVPSPVILDSAVYFIGGKAKALRVGMRASRVSEKEKRTAEVFTPENLWETNLNDEFYASPVIHNGFIYSVTKKGVYVVLDAKSGKKLLSHDLEIDSEFGPSISMAGDKLFVFTDSGVGHVIDPGATFKLLRKNILGDGTVATPAFDAERVFIRGEKKLWCIGKTGVGVTASAGSEGGNTAANSVNTEDSAKAVTPTPIQAGPPTYFTGWRGNGDGRFPDSSPPTQWGKVSKLLHGLRSSAAKPKAETAAQGSPASSGAITEWLILGPLPAEESKGMEQAFFDEVTTQPDSGERVGDTSWKPFKTIENNLDFAALFGKDARGVAYAHSYLFAETEGKVLLSFNHYNNLKVWLNGEVAEVKNNAHSATLKEGWNRLLCKVDWAAQKGQYDIYPSLWYLGISIASLPPFEAETHNILWQARLPNWSISGPLIHGDRIYVMCEPNDLACFDKSDGRLLWIRSNNFYDALPEAEKGKAPFADIASRAARLKEVNESFVTGKWPDTNTLRERGNLNREINDLMAGIDKETYSRNWAEMHGYTVGTPVTDGEDIYIWIAYGIGARYDRDGNRKWIHFEQEMIKHHGYTSSPVLVDGKMIAYMKKLIALDMTTGKIVWRFDAAKDEKLYGDHFHETPIVIQSEGKNLIYVHGMLVRPGDGKVLFDNSTWKWKASIPTAITANGKLFQFNSGGNLMIAEFPASASEPKLINTAELSLFPEAGSAYKRTFLAASPLYHEGLLYVVDCMGSCQSSTRRRRALFTNVTWASDWSARPTSTFSALPSPAPS
ncbi:MAG: PQQ-binding-like beta-propeller repeat protein [Planctomycetota bacterium]|nr:PQQ-binding-like beta-propeller repeat protein [Planctomycetota bacterium]